jgi:hypothetical protein
MSDSTDLVVDARLQSLDSPQSGSATQPVALAGWAVDRGVPVGTGVDAVPVWAMNTSTGHWSSLRVATYL